MSKYIDVEKLKAEIEKLKVVLSNPLMRIPGPDYVAGGKKIAKEILAIIDSLQQEQPDVDIREEIKKLEFMGSNDARDIEAVAKHFYELGLKSK